MKEVLAYSASEQSGAHTKVLIILGLWNPLVPTHTASAFTQKTSQTIRTFDLIAAAKTRLNV